MDHLQHASFPGTPFAVATPTFDHRSGLLAIDVGNSRVKYGWFEPEQTDYQRTWPRCASFAATPLSGPTPWNLIREWANPLECEVVIAGSNPAFVEQLATHWEATTARAPTIIRDRCSLPIQLDVESPEKVGLDRLLNAVAINELRPPHQPAIVIDSGTATTVDVISADGQFCGGAILPGFALSSRALHHYTALLPELTLAELGSESPHPLGRNTHAALRSGIFWGQVGAVRELLQRLRECSLAGVEPWLALTGGGAPWLATQFPGVMQIPSLAMHGLALSFWNSGRPAS